jgi:TRAP-type C4-dicarboxylate transport system permease small subunit
MGLSLAEVNERPSFRRRGALRIKRLNDLIATALDWAIGLIMTAIVIVTFLGVILRYVFNAPLFWSEEVTLLGMIWMTFLSGGILIRQDKNVCITVVCDMCRPHHANRIRNLADFLVLFILIVMITLSWLLIGRLGLSTTPALKISEAWFGWALLIGFLVMLYYQIQRVAAVFRRTPRPFPDASKSGECRP